MVSLFLCSREVTFKGSVETRKGSHASKNAPRLGKQDSYYSSIKVHNFELQAINVLPGESKQTQIALVTRPGFVIVGLHVTSVTRDGGHHNGAVH